MTEPKAQWELDYEKGRAIVRRWRAPAGGAGAASLLVYIGITNYGDGVDGAH